MFLSCQRLFCLSFCIILGDPGTDSGDKGKSKQAEKYGTKKSKERREEPLGTMSYQTSSKLSLSFWILIGARKLLRFSAQSEGRTAATVWNWSGKTLSPGALLAVLYFSSFHIYFPARLDFPEPPLSAPGSPRMFLHVMVFVAYAPSVLFLHHFSPLQLSLVTVSRPCCLSELILSLYNVFIHQKRGILW